MTRLPVAALLLAGCGGDAAPPEPPTDGTSLYLALCAARGLPEAPPVSPRQHLHALGTVEFVGTGQVVTQRAELWLAGPERLRFQATAATGTRNIFLLEAAGIGWANTAHDPKNWERYDSPEVAREARLRWELLRFPWGWREIVAAAHADARSWTRPEADGGIVIEIGEDLLPRMASYAGVEVTLRNWLPADDAPWRIARAWDWRGPSGSRAESYDEVDVQWLLFDDWFRPPAAGGGPDRAYRAVGAEESFSVVRATLWVIAAAPVLPDESGRQWWLRDGERVAGVLLNPDSPPPAADGAQPPVAQPYEHWLRWSFVSDPAGAHAAAAEIADVARAAGLRVLGPEWLSEPDRDVNSVTILLPVQPKDG